MYQVLNLTKVLRKCLLLFSEVDILPESVHIIRQMLLCVTQAHSPQTHAFVLYGLQLLVIILSTSDTSTGRKELDLTKNMNIILHLIIQLFL